MRKLKQMKSYKKAMIKENIEISQGIYLMKLACDMKARPGQFLCLGQIPLGKIHFYLDPLEFAMKRWGTFLPLSSCRKGNRNYGKP